MMCFWSLSARRGQIVSRTMAAVFILMQITGEWSHYTNRALCLPDAEWGALTNQSSVLYYLTNQRSAWLMQNEEPFKNNDITPSWGSWGTPSAVINSSAQSQALSSSFYIRDHTCPEAKIWLHELFIYSVNRTVLLFQFW